MVEFESSRLGCKQWESGGMKLTTGDEIGQAAFKSCVRALGTTK